MLSSRVQKHHWSVRSLTGSFKGADGKKPSLQNADGCRNQYDNPNEIHEWSQNYFNYFLSKGKIYLEKLLLLEVGDTIE